MRRSRLALFALVVASSALLACAAEPPPRPPPIAFQLPTPLPPPPPPAPPPLLVVPRAEATPRPPPRIIGTSVPDLRADGTQHSLQRTIDGIIAVSADRGVLGFLKPPTPGAPIRWAGLGEKDAVLVATADTLHRAATPDDALAGNFESLSPLDPAATLLASAGKIVVAAVPGPEGAYYESRDGGRHFKIARRPAKGALVDLTVRSDGLIVAAIEQAPAKDAPAREGVRAQLFTAKSAGAWTPGPIAERTYGPILSHRGDSIVVLSPKKEPSEGLDTIGLDAKGRWIPAGFPDPWLSFTWSDYGVVIAAPKERPGFAAPSFGIGGLLGGMMGSGLDCHGAYCLGHRPLLNVVPNVGAFHDGVCAKENVKEHKVMRRLTRNGVTTDETHSEYDCDKGAPAQRASTLRIRDGEARRVARLPTSCASGKITGSSRAAFVYCDAQYRGRPSLLHVAPTGALTEVASGIAGDLEILGAASADDGTTAIVANQAAWICAVAGAPACTSVPHEQFLAALPLPGGRALVARAAGQEELDLELFGEPGARPVEIAVHENVLEIEITAESNVRIWTSPTLRQLSPRESLARSPGEPRVEAFLVRVDGKLVPDPAAKEALLREIAAERAAR